MLYYFVLIFSSIKQHVTVYVYFHDFLPSVEDELVRSGWR